MKFSVCLLPADAAALVEEFLRVVDRLGDERRPPEQRQEDAARTRLWLVEMRAALTAHGAPASVERAPPSMSTTDADGFAKAWNERYDRLSMGRTPPIHSGPQRTPPVVRPGPKKPCGCDDKASAPVHPGSRETRGIRQRIQERARARFRQWLLGDEKKR